MRVYLEAISLLVARRDLSRDHAAAVMGELMDGALEPVQIAALLTALAAKGETADELAGLAEAVRRRAVRVDAGECVDTCGTGGSGLDTPNTSTICAFVLAAGGVRVAKHGNRASTGKCGSADVLERLGVAIDLGPDLASRLLAEQGLAFLLAPRYHPAIRHAGPVRKAIGLRTTFNFLGPLANPAGARRQVLGVSDRMRAPLMAEALLRLGTEHAWIVHGSDGLDEITLTGPTDCWEIRDGRVFQVSIDPAALGIPRASASEIAGGGVEDNAALFEAVLDGRAPNAIMDLVAVNAAAGFVVAGQAGDLATGLARAREVLASGAARAKLAAYRAAAHSPRA